jgi:hypothetical protein
MIKKNRGFFFKKNLKDVIGRKNIEGQEIIKKAKHVSLT